MHPCCDVTVLLLLMSTPAFAQSYMPLPNQLSLGVGVVGDRQPGQHSPAAILSLHSPMVATTIGPIGWVSSSKAG